jgi:hypothetical protein
MRSACGMWRQQNSMQGAYLIWCVYLHRLCCLWVNGHICVPVGWMPPEHTGRGSTCEEVTHLPSVEECACVSIGAMACLCVLLLCSLPVLDDARAPSCYV